MINAFIELFDGFQLRSAGTDHVESACIAVGVHHFTGNFNSLIVDNAGWASEKSEKFTVGVCGFDSVEKSRNDVVSAGCLSAGEDDADVAHSGRVGIVPWFKECNRRSKVVFEEFF